MTNFSRRRRQINGLLNSLLLKPVIPQILMIGALTIDGKIFLCYFEKNSSAIIMIIFQYDVIEHLDNENNLLRKDTYLG
jgi:hypothetical protein